MMKEDEYIRRNEEMETIAMLKQRRKMMKMWCGKSAGMEKAQTITVTISSTMDEGR